MKLYFLSEWIHKLIFDIMKHLSIGYRPKCMKTAVRHNSHLLIVSNFFRKSYYNYFFALFILFLSSCIQKDKESKNIFNSATSVTCEEMPIDFMLGVPNQLELIDSLLIIADKVDDGTVVIYDYKNNKLINRILREGQGPEDVILPLQLMVKRKNEIGILQRQNGVYSRYDLSSLLRGSVKSIEKMKFGRIDKMIETSKGYITCGFYEEGGSIGIHDKSGNLTKVIDEMSSNLITSERKFFLSKLTELVTSESEDPNRPVTDLCSRLLEIVNRQQTKEQSLRDRLSVVRSHVRNPAAPDTLLQQLRQTSELRSEAGSLKASVVSMISSFSSDLSKTEHSIKTVAARAIGNPDFSTT
jgi:hypothetical protein